VLPDPPARAGLRWMSGFAPNATMPTLVTSYPIFSQVMRGPTSVRGIISNVG
jgi:hypothetical protein